MSPVPASDCRVQTSGVGRQRDRRRCRPSRVHSSARARTGPSCDATHCRSLAHTAWSRRRVDARPSALHDHAERGDDWASETQDLAARRSEGRMPQSAISGQPPSVCGQRWVNGGVEWRRERSRSPFSDGNIAPAGTAAHDATRRLAASRRSRCCAQRQRSGVADRHLARAQRRLRVPLRLQPLPVRALSGCRHSAVQQRLRCGSRFGC